MTTLDYFCVSAFNRMQQFWFMAAGPFITIVPQYLKCILKIK